MRTLVMDVPRDHGEGTCGPCRGFLEEENGDGAADDEDELDECTHVPSEEHGMTELDWILSSIRRLVPTPTSAEVEKREIAVYETFKDGLTLRRCIVRGTSAVERLCLPGVTPAPLRISKKRKSTWNCEVEHGGNSLIRNGAVVS